MGTLGAFDLSVSYPYLPGWLNPVIIAAFQLAVIAMLGRMLSRSLYGGMAKETWFKGNRIGLEIIWTIFLMII